MHDEDNNLFFWKNRKIKLSRNENKILKILIENKNRWTQISYFSNVIYGDSSYYSYKCIIQLIYRLRKKLKKKVEILNLTNRGYKIGRYF